MSIRNYKKQIAEDVIDRLEERLMDIEFEQAYREDFEDKVEVFADLSDRELETLRKFVADTIKEWQAEADRQADEEFKEREE